LNHPVFFGGGLGFPKITSRYRIRKATMKNTKKVTSMNKSIEPENENEFD
jgi:hypothetical protein